MSKFTQQLRAFWADEEGLTTVEYAVAGGLIALVVILAFKALGSTVGSVITGIDSTLKTNAVPGGA